MCILLKLDYAKFGVSTLFFFSKIIEEKPLGGRLDPPPTGKGGLRKLKSEKKFQNLEAKNQFFCD